MSREHAYAAHLVWEGNTGEGTATYAGYGRGYRVSVDGKPALEGSAAAAFRGDPARHDPEDLLLAAVSSCQMLSYLALCARGGVRVVAYEDRAEGMLVLEPDGGGQFATIVLHPVVTVADAEQVDDALRLHERAHALCFIARSCSVPIHHQPEIRVAGGAARNPDITSDNGLTTG
jgi:organic hydroperoxide reductase OsmC/OhrA